MLPQLLMVGLPLVGQRLREHSQWKGRVGSHLLPFNHNNNRLEREAWIPIRVQLAKPL
jgi:hypothetical protein